MKYINLLNSLIFANIVVLLFGIIGIELIDIDRGYAQSTDNTVLYGDIPYRHFATVLKNNDESQSSSVNVSLEPNLEKQR